MTRTVLLVTLSAGLVLGSAAPCAAQALDDMAGTYKRVRSDAGAKDAETHYYRLELVGSTLQGLMVNPADDLECEITLKPDGQRALGWATWLDPKINSRIETKWELDITGPGKMSGRCEWVDWALDNGEILDRGWYGYTLTRLPKVGLVTEGEGEEPFGDPVEDPRTLAGAWIGAGGAWDLTVDGDQLTLRPLGEHHKGAVVHLTDERGTLRGEAKLGSGATSQVELAAEEGRLYGRSSWREPDELGDLAEKGWASLELKRPPRIDGSPESAADVPPPEPGEEGPLSGVFKRDDGLYLRVRQQDGATVGDLVDREGNVSCRLTFRSEDGLQVAEANWDGVAARWELALQGDALSGRCEYLDVHEGQVLGRGWTPRSFTPLRRVQ